MFSLFGMGLSQCSLARENAAVWNGTKSTSRGRRGLGHSREEWKSQREIERQREFEREREKRCHKLPTVEHNETTDQHHSLHTPASLYRSFIYSILCNNRYTPLPRARSPSAPNYKIHSTADDWLLVHLLRVVTPLWVLRRPRGTQRHTPRGSRPRPETPPTT